MRIMGWILLLTWAACARIPDGTTFGVTGEYAAVDASTAGKDAAGNDMHEVSDVMVLNEDVASPADIGPDVKDAQAAPCGGPCPSGQKCGADNTCYPPCGGPCAASSFCDETTPPGTCKAFAAPTKWGISGDNKVQKLVSLHISDKTKSCDLVNAAGVLGNADGVGDNALAGAASLMGSSLQDAVNKGSVVLLFEPKSYKTDGTAFSFNVLLGDQDAADKAAGVDLTKAGGKYTVKKESYDLTKCDAAGCPARVLFSPATTSSGALEAKTDKFFLNLNMSSVTLALTLSAVVLTGTTTDGTSWVTTTGGRLCGYITETDLNGAVDALPDDLVQQFGGKDQLKKLISSLIKSDVDSNSDGIKDAKSVSLDFSTLGGTISGMSP